MSSGCFPWATICVCICMCVCVREMVKVKFHGVEALTNRHIGQPHDQSVKTHVIDDAVPIVSHTSVVVPDGRRQPTEESPLRLAPHGSWRRRQAAYHAARRESHARVPPGVVPRIQSRPQPRLLAQRAGGIGASARGTPPGLGRRAGQSIRVAQTASYMTPISLGEAREQRSRPAGAIIVADRAAAWPRPA